MPTVKQVSRNVFGSVYGMRPADFTSPNYRKYLDTLGKNPRTRAAIKELIGGLGLVPQAGAGLVADRAGIFADGAEFWTRKGFTCCLVAHPTKLTNDHIVKLKQLATVPGVAVAVDDRESYGGHGTHHVRISVAGLKPPGDGESPFYSA